MSRLTHNLLLATIVTVSLAASANAQTRWYFGMNVQLYQTSSAKFLKVTSVTPNSPAARGGLEPGDLIYSVNNTNFNYANSDWQGRNILQQATSNAGSPPPGLPTTMVATTPGTARMQVWDHRTGQYTQVVCYAHDKYAGGGGGLPTVQVNPNPGFNPPGNGGYPAPPTCGGGGYNPPRKPGCGGGGYPGGGNPGGGVPTSNPGNGNGSLPTALSQGVQMFKKLGR